MNEKIIEDLTRLRDELVLRAFNGHTILNSDLAEVVYKINSCLGKGYPRREEKLRPVYIKIYAEVGTGKTCLQQLIAKVLREHGVSHVIDWGLDGNPNRTDQQMSEILEQAKQRIHVTLQTVNLRRSEIENGPSI